MKVSVVIAVYQGESTIERALESVFSQRLEDDFEVIVVDDGSTDATAEILGRYAGRLTVIRQPNAGAGAARNVGVAHARGDYVAFLDADDLWLEGKLETTAGVLDKRPEVVLVYSDGLSVEANGAVISQSFVPPEMAHAPAMGELLRRWWPILPSAVVMHRRAFVESGGFCPELRAYEDPDLWMRVRGLGEFFFVPHPFISYRTTPIDQRMERYERYHPLFVHRVLERHGRDARPLVRATRRAYATAFGYKGLGAMRAGDRRLARRSFIRALNYAPFDLKNAMRLLRTLLPWRVSRALTGRSRKAQPVSPRT